MTAPVERDTWAAHADACAEKVMASMVNRANVWGQYVPLSLRKKYGKVLTAPARKRRGVEQLSKSHLVQHFRGTRVLGLHTTAPDNTSRWGALDFDMHDAEGVALTDEKREAVTAAFEWCIDVMGERVSLLLEDSDGNGGRHLWFYFTEPIDTAALYVWLAYVANRCARVHGYRPETFPKQPRLPVNAHGVQQFGNWLRLPGEHHTRTHWSQLARPGDAWQSGAGAVTVFLEWPATPVDAIPPLAAYPAPQAVRVASTAHRAPHDLPRDRASAIARYIEKVPHGSEGTGRSDHLYRLAAFLRHDMRCTDMEALPILHAWNAGNLPPLPDAKVQATWANAASYGGRRVA